MEEYEYKDITGKVIGAAMQVHKVLGNGFQEVIYTWGDFKSPRVYQKLTKCTEIEIK